MYRVILVVKEYQSYAPPRLRIHLKEVNDLDSVDFLLQNTPNLQLWAVFTEEGKLAFHSTSIEE